jgi:hypothetical protein
MRSIAGSRVRNVWALADCATARSAGAAMPARRRRLNFMGFGLRD